jgi:threonine/homoserine/homoserine lactone efflux protein
MDLLVIGLSLGGAAGTSPGPLLTLVLTSTLARGFASGFRIAIAPLITDAPIILLCVLGMKRLPDWALTALSIAGALYVIYLGLATLRSSPAETIAAEPVDPKQDLVRGAIVNFLNPHPWVFWATVGGPLLVGGLARSTLTGVLFLIGFYVALVGASITLAGMVAGGRRRLSMFTYRKLFTASGTILLLLGFLLLFRAMMSIEG